MTRDKLSSIAVLSLLLAFSLSADPLLLADWKWTDPDGAFHEYGVYRFPDQSWNLSNDKVDEGWYLATITSAEEQKALICGLRGIRGEYWLGGCQANRGAGPADNWAWVTGEEWSYNHWAPGEPNDAYGSNSEQHLAVWSMWGKGNNGWLWNDEGRLPNINGYIAEKSHAVPEPESVSLFAAGSLALLCAVRKRKM
ncbi:MAG: hypothetical protein JW913_10275 [Chitinispirillaceae bacterium]|nr:hypothetical protein [Chitinispirillaceae bacterium]